MDAVMKGSALVSFKYDAKNKGFETEQYTLTGDTSPAELQGLELKSPSLSVVFKNTAVKEAFRLDAFTLFYGEEGLI